MSRPKLKLIVSDFHLGTGHYLANGSHNTLEDFFFDGKFIEFLQYYSKDEYQKAEVELVINGDFFNHINIVAQLSKGGTVTEKAAMEATERIVSGHPEVFDALKVFNIYENHSIVFTVGNHDCGLYWPAVKKWLMDYIGGSVRVFDREYYVDGVYIEHGNQYIVDNTFDLKNLFVENVDGDKILNLPWGALFSIFLISKAKSERPYIDRVYPFKLYLRWALVNDTRFALRIIFKVLAYFFNIHFRGIDKRKMSLKHTLKIMKEFTLPPKLDRFAKKILTSKEDCRIVVFGHTHEVVYKQFAPGKEYFNTGIWNETINLEIGSIGKWARLTFVEIVYDKKDVPHATLKVWKGTHREVEEAI